MMVIEFLRPFLFFQGPVIVTCCVLSSLDTNSLWFCYRCVSHKDIKPLLDTFMGGDMRVFHGRVISGYIMGEWYQGISWESGIRVFQERVVSGYFMGE